MIIYDTKKEALENMPFDCVTVKVCGGWAVMTMKEYYIWRLQK